MHTSNVPGTNQAIQSLYQKDWSTRMLYPLAERVLSAPDRIEHWATEYSTKQGSNFLGKLKRSAVNVLAWGGRVLSDYDHWATIRIGSRKVTAPAIGALLMLLFPFTIVPRVVQAIKRDKTGESGEVGDILRRDFTTIAALVFLYDPLKDALTALQGWWNGIQINGHIKDEMGISKVLGYDTIKDVYKVDTEQALAAMIGDKGQNRQGILNALYKLTNAWKQHAGADIQETVHQLETTVTRLMEASTLNNQRDMATLSSTAHKLVTQLDTYRTDHLKGLGASLSKQVAAKLPEAADFVVRYARTRRLPIDILAFALAIFGIGYFPVWFNDRLSKQKQQADQSSNNAFTHASPTTTAQSTTGQAAFTVPPSSTFSALKQTSRLANPFYNSQPSAGFSFPQGASPAAAFGNQGYFQPGYQQGYQY